MKNFLILVPFILLTSCYVENNVSSSSYSYNDVKDKVINLDEMFSLKDENYFVYVYSYGCTHCKEIKDLVISYALSTKTPFYFLEFTKDIQIKNDKKGCIGVYRLIDFYIYGTPSLYFLESNTIYEEYWGSDKISNYLNNNDYNNNHD